MIQALTLNKYNSASNFLQPSPESSPVNEPSSLPTNKGDTIQISTAGMGSLLSKILRPSHVISVSSIEEEFRRDSALIEKKLALYTKNSLSLPARK